MTSLIFRTATRFLMALLLLFALFLLLRGHDLPGGGFVGGLVAAAAFALHALAWDVAATRRALRVEPRTLIGAGLGVAGGSGVPALLRGQPFMTGQWGVHVGTPLVFDCGVFLVVVGVTLAVLLTLAEE